MSPAAPLKLSARAKARAILALTPRDQLALASQQVSSRILALPRWQQARAVLLYVPIARELDITPLIHAALAQGKRLALPRVLSWHPASIDIAWATSLDALVTETQGIRQPPPTAPAATWAEIDLAVIPGLAFDSLCRRLGRGGGFYDVLLHGRARLAERAHALVGVSLDELVWPQVPHEAHDVPLDCVITQTRTYDAPRDESRSRAATD